MTQRPASPFRTVSYMRLLAVELAGAFLVSAVAFLPFLFLKSLFSPAFYGLLLAALALSLAVTLLRWSLGGIRSVEVDGTGFLLRRGREGVPFRVEGSGMREVRVRSSRIVVDLASPPEGRRSRKLTIPHDGFPQAEFRELGRRLAALRRRP